MVFGSSTEVGRALLGLQYAADFEADHCRGKVDRDGGSAGRSRALHLYPNLGRGQSPHNGFTYTPQQD
jgi:hypothetical protein